MFLKSSAFRLIDLGIKIILSKGSNARIRKYHCIAIKEGKIESQSNCV